MRIPSNVHLILRRVAEKLLPDILKQRNVISAYRSNKAVVLLYNDEKLMSSRDYKNQLSISMEELKILHGDIEEYLTKRVKLFIALDSFLRTVIPEINFISEDQNTIGITFHKEYMGETEVARLYYEKTLLSNFVNEPDKTKDHFLDEFGKSEKLIADKV